jgi:endonuclease-3
MRVKERIKKIMEALDEEYGEGTCSLIYTKPYELLMATRLSAQCTDARVNMVTKELFLKYPTLQSIAEASLPDMMEMVRSCGFYKVKAKNLIEIAQILLEEYGGVVPDTIEELIRLPGVGRKTANLIVGDIYNKPCVVADTHCIRISNCLGLCNTTDPYKVEITLRKILPEEKSANFCHQLVWHGRKYCIARRPKCNLCPLYPFCPTGGYRPLGENVKKPKI